MSLSGYTNTVEQVKNRQALEYSSSSNKRFFEYNDSPHTELKLCVHNPDRPFSMKDFLSQLEPTWTAASKKISK